MAFTDVVMQSIDGLKKDATSDLWCPVSLPRDQAFELAPFSPVELQLSKADVESCIIVARRAETNELGRLVVTEPNLCCLVKTVDDAVKVIVVV